MTKLVEKVLPKGKGNHSSGEERSCNGRMGRGANAFEGKITAKQKDIDKRVEEIAKRNPVTGYIPVSYPLAVKHEWLKGIKL